jgi:SAM-dependent methyltransferase
MALFDAAELERSSVVANAAMNRERRAVGVNSYERELGFDPIAFLGERLAANGTVAWLDLCCGRGRALVDAARSFAERAMGERVRLVGVDLIDMFDDLADLAPRVRLLAASPHTWQTDERFDLVTCVHGLHYIGDKLGLVARAAGCLADDGLFAANLDEKNLLGEDSRPLGRKLVSQLRACGFDFDRRRHLLTRRGRGQLNFDFEFVGADPNAGPNYSRQNAVNSVYQRGRGGV